MKKLAEKVLEKKFKNLKDAETDIMGIMSAATVKGIKADAKNIKRNMLADGGEITFEWKDGKKYRIVVKDME